VTDSLRDYYDRIATHTDSASPYYDGPMADEVCDHGTERGDYCEDCAKEATCAICEDAIGDEATMQDALGQDVHVSCEVNAILEMMA